MCALRHPSLAALWLGATLSGLAPMVIDFVTSGTPPLDPSASAWTGCPQSFLDMASPDKYAKPTAFGMKITRANVWRLLYLPPIVDDDLHYESPPFSPWEPVGMTTFEDSEIRVRLHRDCTYHPLVYRHWSWIREDGSTTDDEGFKPGIVAVPYSRLINRTSQIDIPSLPLPDQEASLSASQEVFGWVTANCEGHPPEGIYLDRWLQTEEASEANRTADDSSSSGGDYSEIPVDDTRPGVNIQKWITELD